MAIIKCKMCGGDLAVTPGTTVSECEYCGTKQTLPKANDEVIQNLFNRANHLRLKCEFDKAEQIYEKILQENDAESEAHWGVVLCKYGIEYVEDPKNHKRVPTCHRASYDALTADADYLAALEHADADQRSVYEAEAKAIDEIQKNILNIVKNEKPFDVFLCYKETDDNGKRTVDSAIANDIYHQLTQEGLKVFYAAITLEDKLGQAYEPYIFAALNSAKVMLVIGTKPQYFTAVWVKNEWSRFLKLMKTHHSKLLIPCYKDMDAYDLPEEFSHLQAQDMSKIGFINDVVRGVRKVTVAAEEKPAEKEPEVVGVGGAGSLLRRAFLFLEDGDWDSADEYCEKVLDIDPENPRAYLGKLMAQLQVCRQEALKDCPEPFDGNSQYQKVIRFADDALKTELAGYNEHIQNRNEEARLESIYTTAAERMKNAESDAKDKDSQYTRAAELFETIREYRDAAQLEKRCLEAAEAARKDKIYYQAVVLTKQDDAQIAQYKRAITLLQMIPGWRDADLQVDLHQKKIEALEAQAEAECLEQERKAKRNKKIAIIAVSAVCVIVAIAILLNTVIIPAGKYSKAKALLETGKYEEAVQVFQSLGNFKDSSEQAKACSYAWAKAMAEAGEPLKAVQMFQSLGDYKDSAEQADACNYAWAKALLEAGRYEKAARLFRSLGDYQDSPEQENACNYAWAKAMAEAGEPLKAVQMLRSLGDYQDAKAQAAAIWDQIAVREVISAGYSHTVGLRADGTVVAVGWNADGQCNVSGWKDIVAVSAGVYHTVGLRADGRVVAVGRNANGQCDVSDWKDIVAISAGDYHTVGLRADGTVVAAGDNDDGRCNVSGWKDIVAVSAGYNHTVGLRADGRVVAVGSNKYGQCDVSRWKNIVAISAGDYHTVGLRADGTVVAAGRNDYGRCDVSSWKDIVAISAGDYHTVGLRADGTVVAAGDNEYGQCDVSGWKDMVAISAGDYHTVGLRADGTVVAVGNNEYGACDVSDWNNIKTD